MEVGVVVVTHAAKHHLPHCLPPLLQSPLHPRVLVMNSSSGDGTVEMAKEMGAETLVIPRKDFNHGLSREKARKKLGTDIVVMVTPDAYAADVHTLGNLVRPLLDGKASLSYAKQIPHDDADCFASFARWHNYPHQSHIRGEEDKNRWGIYTIFLSNSFAAYRNSALDEVGGFERVLIGEDTFTAAKLLQRGHKIAYVAEAVVRHSHNYTLKEEFMRSFDTGLARKMNKELITPYGLDEKQGGKYILQLLRFLLKAKPGAIPLALLQSVVKYAGYRLGRWSLQAPLPLKRICSAQDFYWETGSRDPTSC